MRERSSFVSTDTRGGVGDTSVLDGNFQIGPNIGHFRHLGPGSMSALACGRGAYLCTKVDRQAGMSDRVLQLGASPLSRTENPIESFEPHSLVPRSNRAGRDRWVLRRVRRAPCCARGYCVHFSRHTLSRARPPFAVRSDSASVR